LHDAFDAICTLALSSGALGQHRGLPVTVTVTMTLDQLETGTGVTTTATGGVMSVQDALAMAETVHPLLTLFDHTGVPLHLGRGTRLASKEQRLLLTAWQRGCTRPGCDVPASHCAVHHMRECRAVAAPISATWRWCATPTTRVSPAPTTAGPPPPIRTVVGRCGAHRTCSTRAAPAVAITATTRTN
jgi:hypothetical protein